MVEIFCYFNSGDIHCMGRDSQIQETFTGSKGTAVSVLIPSLPFHYVTSCHLFLILQV